MHGTCVNWQALLPQIWHAGLEIIVSTAFETELEKKKKAVYF